MALKAALGATLAGTTHRFELSIESGMKMGPTGRVLCRGSAVPSTGRCSTRSAGSLTETTERSIAQQRLRGAGAADTLTGLHNRAVFVARLGHRLEDLQQHRGDSGFAVLYLDLDRF